MYLNIHFCYLKQVNQTTVWVLSMFKMYQKFNHASMNCEHFCRLNFNTCTCFLCVVAELRIECWSLSCLELSDFIIVLVYFCI